MIGAAQDPGGLDPAGEDPLRGLALLGGREVCLALLHGFLVAHQLLGPVDQADTEAAERDRERERRAPACSTGGAYCR